MDEKLIKKVTEEFKMQGVDDVSIRVSRFLNEPWLYFLVYHNGRGVIYDMSVRTYEKYGICLDIVKDEWSKIHNERW